jgi:[ribosomal protein S18]-alanine N-acetyltransferase
MIEVTTPYAIRPLTIDDGMEIAMWRYPGPWAVYDNLEQPRADQAYWAVDDAKGHLVGFCCFGDAARMPGVEAESGVLDVAIGMRPELVGGGYGDEFARAVVEHARSIAEGRRLRSVVPAWNTPGRRAAERAGFTEVGQLEVGAGPSTMKCIVFTQETAVPRAAGPLTEEEAML